MKHITVDINKIIGAMKPMHGVNNGPVPGADSRGRGNAYRFREAGIPFIRNHDASLFSVYGGEHTVDVDLIFPNFDADENDPANYDFDYTDAYCQAIYDAGGQLVYRLGAKIEHGFKKYNTRPPKDFHKWARICEHIIRHLVYGWANGLHLNITYWEIWNEADGINPDGISACWQGTREEFYEFYHIVATHLKEQFPELKIGGPAYTCAHPGKPEQDGFVAYVQEHKTPLDFYSFHGYTDDPQYISETTRFVRSLLDEHGLKEAEIHLNEWNYMTSWVGEEHLNCLRMFRSNKAAAFCAACILEAQHSPMDMFMYYDAAPGSEYNGWFDRFDFQCLEKPYYAFWQFNQLYQLHNEVEVNLEGEYLYAAAAAAGEQAAVQVVCYSANEIADDTVEVNIKGLKGKYKITCLLIDEDHDNEPVRKEVFTSEECSIYLHLHNCNTYLLQVKMVED